MSLDGRVALVTGTGPNIGQEIACTLAANGAKVVCLDLALERAQSCAQKITKAGGSATAVAADITKPADVEKAVKAAASAFGGLHILVNNAAITAHEGLLDAKVESWRQVIDVILTGAFLCSQYAAKQMIAQGSGGAIVNIASTSGHRGSGGAIAYATAKGGILNLTRAMAIGLAKHKIRVNSVTPTQTGTAVGGGRSRGEGEPPKNIPLGRWGRPIDQAQAVLFLVSPEADFITGIDLPVDGGILAYFPTG
ncbi:MAG: SDR family oxidoreductase [Chloroflexi bacterium]|nr:SDR family oxidoreductase [Chloroflexota bacterium]